MFLIVIGELFYYKSAYNSIIRENKLILLHRIDKFMQNKVKKKGLKNLSLLENMAIFKGNKLLASNFDVPKLSLNKEIIIKNDKIYYIKKLIRPFGIVYLVTFKKFHTNLIERLFIFNIFVFIFIVFVAFILGNVFLSPMKRAISNLEDFITDTTHEMNTPISVIMSNIEMLELKGIENKELFRITNSAKRLSKIFDDLKFLRLNHSTKKEIINIDLTEFILNRVKYFEIDAQLKLDQASINIDREDLIRIIDNLLSNAKKYSNTFIEIELTKEYLLIKNDGEIKNIKNITKKYIRENKEEGGFGVGLYIVEKICIDYGFVLEIKNNEGVEIKIVYK